MEWSVCERLFAMQCQKHYAQEKVKSSSRAIEEDWPLNEYQRLPDEAAVRLELQTQGELADPNITNLSRWAESR